MHQSDDIMMTNALMKIHEIRSIEFVSVPKANVVAIYDKFKIQQIASFYHMNMVAVNN